MNVVSVSVEVHRPFGTLSLPFFSIRFFLFFFLFHYPSRSFSSLLLFSFSQPTILCHSLPLVFSHLLSLSHTQNLLQITLSLFLPPPPLSLISFLNVSLSSSSQWISCCRPELKVTCWLGHGLQHRTWVLPLLPARVLCCSQWSCLSASLPVCLPAAAGLSSPNSWIPPTVDLLTLLLTLRLARTLSLSFKV